MKRNLFCVGAFIILSLFPGPWDSIHAQSPGTLASFVAWGDNGQGQTNVPPGLRDVIAISAGETHSMALKRNGTVVAWGDNSWGQANVPFGLGGVVAIAAGGFHSLALIGDGTV